MLSAIATGTVVYVVFFEIFPKGKEVGGTGFQHVFAMAIGFAAFLPSLLFRKFRAAAKGRFFKKSTVKGLATDISFASLDTAVPPLICSLN